jgi:hypothetical protein
MSCALYDDHRLKNELKKDFVYLKNGEELLYLGSKNA